MTAVKVPGKRGRPPGHEGRISRLNFSCRPELKRWLEAKSAITGFSEAAIVDALLSTCTDKSVDEISKVVKERRVRNVRRPASL